MWKVFVNKLPEFLFLSNVVFEKYNNAINATSVFNAYNESINMDRQLSRYIQVYESKIYFLFFYFTLRQALWPSSSFFFSLALSQKKKKTLFSRLFFFATTTPRTTNLCCTTTHQCILCAPLPPSRSFLYPAHGVKNISEYATEAKMSRFYAEKWLNFERKLIFTRPTLSHCAAVQYNYMLST